MSSPRCYARRHRVRAHVVYAGVFDDAFIEHLFDLVETTRNQDDETFNYAVIKLIVRAHPVSRSMID